jgi:hypothetical protein
VADTFDAMTSDRSYRPSMSVGATLNEIVKLSPKLYDPNVVQAMLVQVRRDAVGRGKPNFLEDAGLCTIAPADIDQMAAALSHKVNHGRVYSA